MLLLTAGLVQAVIMAGIPRQTQRGQIVTGISYCADFQSAGQIMASRALGFSEIPTVVITSLLCDLVLD